MTFHPLREGECGDKGALSCCLSAEKCGAGSKWNTEKPWPCVPDMKCSSSRPRALEYGYGWLGCHSLCLRAAECWLPVFSPQVLLHDLERARTCQQPMPLSVLIFMSMTWDVPNVHALVYALIHALAHANNPCPHQGTKGYIQRYCCQPQLSAQHPSPWGAPELPNTCTGLGALGLHCLSSAGRTVESLPRLD